MLREGLEIMEATIQHVETHGHCEGDRAAYPTGVAITQDIVSRSYSGTRFDTTGQVLSHDQDVRDDVVVVDGPHLAGAPEACQDLISNHQPIIAVAYLSNALQESRRRYPVTAFS